MQLSQGVIKRPYFIAIYGVPGIGKTTLCAYAPAPVFCDIDRGTNYLNVIRNKDEIRSLADVYSFIRWAMQERSFQTVVFDSTTALEKLMIKKILDGVNRGRREKDFIDSIRDRKALPFGQGYDLLKKEWINFCDSCVDLVRMGKNVILVGHQSTETVFNPQGEDYRRYSIDVQEKCIPFIISNMDGVFFSHYGKVFQDKSKDRFSDEKIAVDTNQRLLQTKERTFCAAKNRFNLPETIDFTTPEMASNFFSTIG